MAITPFGEPFGMAWIGYVFWIVIFVVGGWLLLFALPWIIAAIKLVVGIAALPFNILTGKSKKGLRQTAFDSKNLFKGRRR